MSESGPLPGRMCGQMPFGWPLAELFCVKRQGRLRRHNVEAGSPL